jgi:sugar phosphate isomerase/epimerase
MEESRCSSSKVGANDWRSRLLKHSVRIFDRDPNEFLKKLLVIALEDFAGQTVFNLSYSLANCCQCLWNIPLGKKFSQGVFTTGFKIRILAMTSDILHLRFPMLDRLSVSEFTTHRWSFYQDVLRYAAEGINQIGIWRTKMDDFDRDEAVDLLFEMKMKVSSIHWAGGFTGADGRKFVDAVDDGIGAVQLAAQVGADCVIVHPGAQNGHTDRHARRIFCSAIDNLAHAAADFGTRIVLEPIPHRPASTFTFYKRFSEYLDIVSAFDPAHVGLAIDLFHVGHLAEAYDRIPEYVDRLAVVQIADRDIDKPPVSMSKGRSVENRKIPGEGGIQIDRWVDKLNRCGYRGAYELEIHGKGFSRSNYRTTIESSLQYLCSPQRSYNLNQKASEAEQQRRERRRKQELMQKELLMQTRW